MPALPGKSRYPGLVDLGTKSVASLLTQPPQTKTSPQQMRPGQLFDKIDVATDEELCLDPTRALQPPSY